MLLPIAALVLWSLFRSGSGLVRRLTSGPVKEWPTSTASIDVVSVAEQIFEGRYGNETTGYTASLTYFYRNPELQIGEYQRNFPLKAAAQMWADGFKNKQVVIHVNPKNPTDSMILDVDLEGLARNGPLTLDESVRMEELPRLREGFLLLSRFAELATIAGLSITLAEAWLHRRSEFAVWPTWLMVMTGVLLAFDIVAAWIVSYRAEDSSAYQAILRGPTRFCPTWMNWLVNGTGALVFALIVVMKLGDEFPISVQGWFSMITPYAPYLLVCWGFLAAGSTHTAILRSQEMTRRIASDAVGVDSGKVS